MLEVLLEEAAARPFEGPVPLQLRTAPPQPDFGLDPKAVAKILAPALSGVVLTRADLARAAHEIGLGLRQGERRFVLAVAGRLRRAEQIGRPPILEERRRQALEVEGEPARPGGRLVGRVPEVGPDPQLVGHVPENPEPVPTQALKGIGAGPGLVGPAPERGRRIESLLREERGE